MAKVLRYFLPVIAVAVVSSAVITPAGGEGTAGSRALAVHTARAQDTPQIAVPAVAETTSSTVPAAAAAPPPVVPAPAPRVASIARKVPTPKPVTVGTIPVPFGAGTNAPLVYGHWWCATNGACYLDPDPNVVTPIGSTDPAYEARLNAELCEIKPYLCPANE